MLALAFGIVVTTGQASIWWICALTFSLGLVLAVERPTTQAILFRLFVTCFQRGRCDYVNAASYLIVIAALLALRTSELVPRRMIGQSKGKLSEGFAYVRSHPEVARPLMVMSIVGAIAVNFPPTFPSMVRFGFDRGAGSVGAACVALGVMPSYWTFVAMSIVLGFASASFQSVNTVVVQQATEPSMQGRPAGCPKASCAFNA